MHVQCSYQLTGGNDKTGLPCHHDVLRSRFNSSTAWLSHWSSLPIFFSWNLFWGLCVLLTTSTAFIISGDWVVQQWNSYINNDLPIWNFDHLRRRLSKHVWLLKVKCRLQTKITKYEKTCVVAIPSHIAAFTYFMHQIFERAAIFDFGRKWFQLLLEA
jgi:hypothetical protein